MDWDWSKIGLDIKSVINKKGFCPFCHSGRSHKYDRSFSVDLEKGIFNCFNCGEKGHILDFYTKQEKAEYYKTHNNTPMVTEAKQQKNYKKLPQERDYNLPENIVNYFKGRGISTKTLLECKISSSTKGFLDKKTNKYVKKLSINFNYFLNGEIVNTKYRSNEKEFILIPGARKPPYLIDNIKNSSFVIITEGEPDALSYYEIGYPNNVVSVPNGASCEPANIFDDYKEYFEGKKIYLSVDKDDSGQKLLSKLLEYFSKNEIFIIDTGQYKDANEVLVHKGGIALQACIDDATPYIYVPPKKVPKKQYDENGTYWIKTPSIRVDRKGVHAISKKEDEEGNKYKTIFKKPLFIVQEIKTEDEVYRILQVGGFDEPEENLKFLKISNEQFSNAKRLRTLFMKNGYAFYGNDTHVSRFFEAQLEYPKAEMCSQLGYNPKCDAYFFANAALKDGQILTPNSFGVINTDAENSFFMPYIDNICGEGVKKFKNAERFIFEKSNLTFNTWYDLVFQAHGIESVLPTVFMIASLFRDIIFSNLHFCPIMYIKGIRGSGKSSLSRNLTAVFGYTQHEISLKSPNTTKSLPRILGQLSNAITWLDEFHNELPNDIKGMLQSVYDGGGYEKAAFTNGIETTSVVINSMLLLTSNYTPEDEIFFSRTIFLEMNNAKKTNEQRAAYKKLTELEKNNLSMIAYDILMWRKLIEKEWKQTYEKIYNFFYNALSSQRIDNRFLENMAGVITPAYILLFHNCIRLYDIDFKNHILDFAMQNIQRQYETLYNNKGEIDFWNIIQRAVENNLLRRDIDFKIKTVDSGNVIKQYIYIRFQRFYLVYSEQAKLTAKRKEEILEQIRASDYYIEDKAGVRFNDFDSVTEIKTTRTTVRNALCLDYEQMQRILAVDFYQE